MEINQARYNTAKTESFYQNSMINAKNTNPKQIGQMFEAMFHRMLLEQMRSDPSDDPIFGSHSMEQVQTMQHDELAQSLGKLNQLGIAEMIEKEIERSGPLKG